MYNNTKGKCNEYTNVCFQNKHFWGTDSSSDEYNENRKNLEGGMKDS